MKNITDRAIKLLAKYNLHGDYKAFYAVLDLKEQSGEPEGTLNQHVMLEFTLCYQNAHNRGKISDKALAECDKFRIDVCDANPDIARYLD